MFRPLSGSSKTQSGFSRPKSGSQRPQSGLSAQNPITQKQRCKSAARSRVSRPDKNLLQKQTMFGINEIQIDRSLKENYRMTENDEDAPISTGVDSFYKMSQSFQQKRPSTTTGRNASG